MTLAEFLRPVQKGTHQQRVLGVLYFMEKYEARPSATVQDIRQALKIARMPGWAKVNLPDVLRKSAHLVHFSELRTKHRLWSLTQSGRNRLASAIDASGTPKEFEQDSATLHNIVAGISDAGVKDYLEEALKCLGAGALRATVVFVWTATIRTLQSAAIGKGHAALNAALQKHDQRAKSIVRIDDFSYIKDSVLLLAARDLGLLDKNEKDTLQEALDLRNRCGHPGQYKPGIKKVSSFIEDTVSIVFS